MRNYAENADIAKDSACKPKLKRWYGLDLSAMAMLIFFIILGQLIWLPDPLRLGQQMYWIELFDELVYSCLLPPLLWGFSACLDLIRLWQRRNSDLNMGLVDYLLIIVRFISIIMSICAVYLILFAKDQYFLMVVSIAIGWAMSLISIHLKESRLGIPVRSLIVLGITLILLALFLLPTQYLVTYPGLTMNMNEYAHIDKGKSDDQIAGVLIFERPAFPVDWVYARLFAQYEFERKPDKAPPLGEQLQEVRTQQINANEMASAVAFAKLGLGRGAVSQGARVVALTKDFPAAKQLMLGDVIIQVYNQPITTTNELINGIKQVIPGDELQLTVKRGNETINVTIQTQADVNDPKKAVIGVSVNDQVELDLPMKVEFKPYLLQVGGPSHGAMLTLAIIDQLTPGGVTHGNNVAGTGTINSLGQVGPIGGIRQKAFTVERTSADVFFVPADQWADARKGATHLNIVAVKTIDDILKWLEEHPKR